MATATRRRLWLGALFGVACPVTPFSKRASTHNVSSRNPQTPPTGHATARTTHRYHASCARPFQPLHSSLGELCGIRYEEPVFRPPAEWRSLILQVTVGCSWNRCTFCEMYQDKTAPGLSTTSLPSSIESWRRGAEHVREVFLADGDAMTLPTAHLASILDVISDRLPRVRRVSSYCLPRNVRYKSVEALASLRSKGLSLVYVGCESGDDNVLAAVNKGETYETSLGALNKLREAGMKRSVMILLGLGGVEHSEAHALNSAALCTAAEPEYLSVLTTSFPRGKRRVEGGYAENLDTAERFVELTPREGLAELERFIAAVDIPRNGRTIFRSDHASNYLVLKGRLGREKDRILGELRAVLDAPSEDDKYNLRPDWSRGL